MFTLETISKAINSDCHFADANLAFQGFSIDSRKIKVGDIFFALKTLTNDGHLFLESAFEKGASGAIVSKEYFETHAHQKFKEKVKNIWVVEDPYTALLDLAKYNRKKSQAIFIGVTGSVGKTSTKEFLGYLLGKVFGSEKVLVTRGNFNNHLGLPLTLLELDESHSVCLCELGANHPGEIKTLCEILKPDYGILTCVSDCHLEGFGSTENIYETKFDLIRSLPSKGVGLIPAADKKLAQMTKTVKTKVLRVGSEIDADRVFSQVKSVNGNIQFTFADKYQFTFPGCAEFYAYNASLALSMIEAIGHSVEKLPSKWDDFYLPEGRFSKETFLNDLQFIFDGYNASPLSFKKGIESINSQVIKGKKILVFSDMLELGDKSDEYHRALGGQIAKSDFEIVAAYGNQSLLATNELKNSDKVVGGFKTQEEVISFLKELIEDGDLVYFKASRGMKIEKVRDVLAPSKQQKISTI